MIEWMRAAISTWTAKLLLGLLVISFAAWGVGDMLRVGAVSAVASVDDEEITVGDFQREFQMALVGAGQGLDAAQARALGLDRIVLEQMAARVALDQETAALGVSASDQAVATFVREAPAFRDLTGDFSEMQFEAVLSRNGMRRNEFYETVRRDLARSVVVDAVMAGADYPTAAAEAIWLEDNETRTIEMIVLPQSDVGAGLEPTDEELATFYDAESERFLQPEFRTITYLWIRAQDRARPEDVTESEIADEYDRRFEDFNSPERRELAQIVFADKTSADDAAARITDGQPFDVIARENGLSPADATIGERTREEMFDADSADAVFATDEVGLVGPIETDFGWTLFDVRSITPALAQSVDEVRDQLIQDIAVDFARSDLPDLANAVEDQRAAGASLLEIADQEDLLARTITINAEGFTERGEAAVDVPEQPDFLARAFEIEIGEEMDLAELPELEYFAVQVDDIVAPASPELDEIKTRVMFAWLADRKRELLDERAEALNARLHDGETIATLAEELGVETQRIEQMSRLTRTDAVSGELVASVFALDAAGDAIDTPVAIGRSRVLAVLDEIVAADPADAAGAIAQQVQRDQLSVANDMLQLFQAAVVSEREFEVFPNAMEFATGGGLPGGYGGGHGGM